MESLSPERAASLLLSKIKPITDTEIVPLKDAHSRVLAEDLTAAMPSPPFDRSPLDGYALRSGDTDEASETKPVRLTVTGKLYAGGVFDGELKDGQAVRIMTGAMMPKGSDCVIRQEEVNTEENDSVVVIKQKVKHNENYIWTGEDIKQGQKLFKAGHRLMFAELAVLASMGADKIRVMRKPEIAVLCTGDELCPPGEPLEKGKIYNSNDFLIGGRLMEMGFLPHILPMGADNTHDVCAEIRSVIGDIDLFISTGAVSVGEKDIFHEVFPFIGVETLFEHLDARPGGSILCGIYRDKPMICLSGNPFAALTGFELIARPAIAKIACRADLSPQRKTVRLTGDVKGKKVRHFMRARVDGVNAVVYEDNHAGQLYSLTGSNCLLDIPANSLIKNGDEVSALMF